MSANEKDFFTFSVPFPSSAFSFLLLFLFPSFSTSVFIWTRMRTITSIPRFSVRISKHHIRHWAATIFTNHRTVMQDITRNTFPFVSSGITGRLMCLSVSITCAHDCRLPDRWEPHHGPIRCVKILRMIFHHHRVNDVVCEYVVPIEYPQYIMVCPNGMDFWLEYIKGNCMHVDWYLQGGKSDDYSFWTLNCKVTSYV